MLIPHLRQTKASMVLYEVYSTGIGGNWISAPAESVG